VPLVRGKEKSVPVDQIINQVNQRVADGYQEVVLTGTRVGAYNDNGVNLKGLIERILAGTGVIRLRLSSLQPDEISLELIKLWSDKRLCPHFHLSLQSGSDTVLSRMRRRYTTADYRQAVTLIRHRLPEVAITTDVIVGFPGETETEFKESCDFCQRMRFARIHVFTYSPRQETNAAHLPAQIDTRIKQQRSQQMLALARESTPKFNRRFLGKTRPVLWEKRSKGVWSGYTDNYIKVYTRSNRNLANQLMPVELIGLNGDGMWGAQSAG
jgi:threonylcarbamoyladenosine tRNA methylthiotransferase MtaB